MPENYIIERSATFLIQNSAKQGAIQNYIQRAGQLDKEYNNLQTRQVQLSFAKQLNLQHQQNIQMAYANGKTKPYVNTTYWNFQDSRNDANMQDIQVWLNDLHRWSLQGYQVIVGLRKEVTGQDLIYHIQDSSGSYHYTLNEDQYLKLLAQNPVGMNYASTSQLEQAAAGGVPMADLFKLQVKATQTNLSQVDIWSQQQGHQQMIKSSLKQDVLYQYLMQNGGVIQEGGKTLHSRIYELYSQLRAQYEWAENPDGSIKSSGRKGDIFFSATRKNAVDNFIAKYTGSNLHKDNTAFYKTGDAIQDNHTLIENKVGNAVVSVSTIRRAIRDIAALGGIKSAAELKKELINLFTYSGKDAFSKKLQDGAKNAAIKAIRELFKS